MCPVGQELGGCVLFKLDMTRAKWYFNRILLIMLVLIVLQIAICLVSWPRETTDHMDPLFCVVSRMLMCLAAFISLVPSLVRCVATRGLVHAKW